MLKDHPAALMSVTFYEPGYEHIVELIHQRDPASRRHLSSLEVAAYDAEGRLLGREAVDPRLEILELGALAALRQRAGRAMVVFDARYDARIFPYRPHHYAYLHRRGAETPPLYYAINAALGGVPDRVDNTRINNFETYLFRRRPFDQRYALMLGNVSRFATAEAQVWAWYPSGRVSHEVTLGPKRHAEVELPAEHAGERLHRVELKSPFRLASYVTARRADGDDLVLFDHLFTFVR